MKKKKVYEKPRFEVTEFRFSEHIAASGAVAQCDYVWGNTGPTYCSSGTPYKIYYNNL